MPLLDCPDYATIYGWEDHVNTDSVLMVVNRLQTNDEPKCGATTKNTPGPSNVTTVITVVNTGSDLMLAINNGATKTRKSLENRVASDMALSMQQARKRQDRVIFASVVWRIC